MKKVFSFILVLSMLVGAFVSCSTSYTENSVSPNVVSLSSSANEYAEWLTERLDTIPDHVILGIGNNNEYDVNMTYFEDDGYIIKKDKGSVVLFGKTEDGLDLACQKYVNDIKGYGYTNNTTHNELPEDYIEFAKAATSNTADDRLTLAFKTDTHLTNTTDVDSLVEFSNIQKYVPIDLYVHGGDLINGKHETESVAKDILSSAVSAMTKSQSVPFVSVRGNHDDNSWTYMSATGKRYGVYPANGILSSDEWRNMAFTSSSSIVMDEEGSYGYMDHEESKIRVLFVDTVDLPYNTNDEGIGHYGAYAGYGMRNRQLNFMANAMQFTDKGDDAKNWAILVVSHVPIETIKNNDPYRMGTKDAPGRNSYVFLQILEAYKNGTDFDMSISNLTNYGSGGYNTGDIEGDFAFSVKADFSKKGPGEVIGFICGHTHVDNYSNMIGYGSYANNNTKIYPELSLGYSYLTFSSFGFSVITIDRNGDGTGNIHVDKYGTSVVVNEDIIADGDNAKVTIDPIMLGMHSSTPASGSIASGNYTVEYSQPKERS